ncbi:Bromodomain-containing protein 4B [Clarias magur]|uniref:Bromodomain-containing protein 4B n=1 Tax=Clarias magur TaxID=1594786 RepID=A0A8J4XEQ7_CLAMG|nr:Bromodomain-containing protein 4B [Clarias magur]
MDAWQEGRATLYRKYNNGIEWKVGKSWPGCIIPQWDFISRNTAQISTTTSRTRLPQTGLANNGDPERPSTPPEPTLPPTGFPWEMWRSRDPETHVICPQDLKICCPDHKEDDSKARSVSCFLKQHGDLIQV